MKSYVMENTTFDDAETEQEILERFEKVLDKIRDRLKKKKQEDQVDAATLYRDDNEYRVHVYGNPFSKHPIYFNNSLQNLETLCG